MSKYKKARINCCSSERSWSCSVLCCITVSLVLVCSGCIQIHNLLNLDILFVVTVRSVTAERQMLSVLQHQTGSAINLFWTDCTVVAPFPDALCNRGQI